MKKFAFSLILAAACSLPALAQGTDHGCKTWHKDDGAFRACVNEAIYQMNGGEALFAGDEEVETPGIFYSAIGSGGQQLFWFEDAPPVLNNCQRDDSGGCIDPNPN